MEIAFDFVFITLLGCPPPLLLCLISGSCTVQKYYECLLYILNFSMTHNPKKKDLSPDLDEVQLRKNISMWCIYSTTHEAGWCIGNILDMLVTSCH